VPPHAASRLPAERPTREIRVPALVPAGFVESGLDTLTTMITPVLTGVVDIPPGLDADLLRAALTGVARLEPAVGACYQRGLLRGCWIVDPDPAWEVAEHGELDEAGAAALERAWIATPHPLHGALPVAAAVLHLPDRDRLLVRVNHLLADAGGVKNLLYLLARCVRRLRDDPAWRPEPRRPSARSYWKVLAALRLARLPAMAASMLREFWAAVPRTTLSVPMEPAEHAVPRVLHLILEPERAARLRERWRDRGFTVNDLLLAAFGVALDRCHGADHPPGRRVAMMVTADLRQHVPTDDDVTNFSTVRFLDLGATPLPPLATYLGEVAARTARWKRSLAGVGGAVMWLGMLPWLPDPLLRLQLRLAVALGAWFPSCKVVLTNMGAIDAARLDFGDGPCRAARLVPPVGRAPILVTGASGCAGRVTFTLTFEDPALPEARARRLLETLDQELRGLE